MPNRFLNDYMKANLRNVQLHQLNILKLVDTICYKYGIEYWLDGGTLLGAVRHKGFIPWDDDIDIAMTMEGLEKFCKLAQNELPENYIIKSRIVDPTCKEPITKIIDLNSVFIENGDVINDKIDKGIFIDIFPFVPCPELPLKLHKKITKGISKSYSILHKQHCYSFRSFAEFIWFGAKYLLLSCLWNICNSFFRKNDYLSNIPINNGMGLRHKVSTVFPIGSISFEGIQFNAPNMPEQYLEDQYGDYLQIPPVEKRISHAYFFKTNLSKEITL